MTETPGVTAWLWAIPAGDGARWQIMAAWRHRSLYAEGPVGPPVHNTVARDVLRWRRAQPFHYRPPRRPARPAQRSTRAMPTYQATVSRSGEQLTLTRPEEAPDWVSELVDDVVWKFEESPDATSVSVTIEAGDDAEQAPTTTTTGASASDVLTSSNPTQQPAAQTADATGGDTQGQPAGAATSSPGDPGTPEANAGTGPAPAGDTSVQTAAAAPETGDGTDQPPPAGTTDPSATTDGT